MVTTNPSGVWGVRLGTLALWALAGLSVVYWGLRLSSAPSGPRAAVAPAAPVVADGAAVARLLGGGAVAPVVAAATEGRMRLVGVLAGRQSGGGAALIALDGKPAKPYRVGATVDEGLVLQSVGPYEARLGAARSGPAVMTLEMARKPGQPGA
jgi:general secretion pathway protein C